MKPIYSIAFYFILMLHQHLTLGYGIPNHLVQHADNCEREIQISHEKLSSYLAAGTTNDEEKVLIFSYWIAKNIHYDLAEVRQQKRTNKTAYEVLRNKKAVCEGYALLFDQFCKNEGITSYVVYGHGYGHIIQRMFNIAHMRHAWNIVCIHGEWKLIDVTWASSEIKNGNFKRDKDLEWIFCHPETFVKTHYPNDPRWQLLENPASRREFWSQSAISKKQYALQDSLNILFSRPKHQNDVILCKTEFIEQQDETVYLKKLLHLGWRYVGGNYDPEKVKQGIEIFEFAAKELENISLVPREFRYRASINKGIQTAQVRLETNQ